MSIISRIVLAIIIGSSLALAAIGLTAMATEHAETTRMLGQVSAERLTVQREQELRAQAQRLAGVHASEQEVSEIVADLREGEQE